MKTLTILFESPNVFYAVIDGVNIRIENVDLLPVSNIGGRWFDILEECYLVSGNIFQVEGFEYRKTWQWRRFNDDEWKNTNAHYAIDCQISGCETREVAILKLAKEEEPKEQKIDVYLGESDFNLLEATTHVSDIFSMIFKKHETFNYTKKVTLTWKK